MAKFIKHTTKNNKNKSFTSVDTATNRGMGRYNHGTGSGGGIGPRVETPGLWLVETVPQKILVIDEEGNGAMDTEDRVFVLLSTQTENIGAIDTEGNALVLVRKF